MSFDRLPVEILERIVDATSVQGQLSLCTSSKVLQELAVRSLYRELNLASKRVVQCCKTLVANKSAALAVRRLLVKADPRPQ